MSEEVHPTASIIIPVHNQFAYTQMCLDSIARCTPEAHEIIIVDNGSSDETVKLIEAPRLRIIRNKRNLGFGPACNQGIAAAKGAHIVILNNDTVVTPGWLTRLIAAAESDPKIGIVGPLTNYSAGPQCVGGEHYTTPEGLELFASYVARQNSGRIERQATVIGFCMLIKRAVVDAIKGFDERFGMNQWEDQDICLSARRAGFEVAVACECYIHHFGSKTFESLGIVDEAYGNSIERGKAIFEKKWGAMAI